MANESLWDFSLRIYSCDGVSAACVLLQDRHGLDVSMLLFCCWYGTVAGAMGDETLAMALDLSRPWAENVVKPVRTVRRYLKTQHDDLYLRLKDLELEVERKQLDMLEALCRDESIPVPNSPAAVGANLRSYCRALSVDTSKASESLSTIVRALFPQLEASALRAMFLAS